VRRIGGRPPAGGRDVRKLEVYGGLISARAHSSCFAARRAGMGPGTMTTLGCPCGKAQITGSVHCARVAQPEPGVDAAPERRGSGYPPFRRGIWSSAPSGPSRRAGPRSPAGPGSGGTPPHATSADARGDADQSATGGHRRACRGRRGVRWVVSGPNRSLRSLSPGRVAALRAAGQQRARAAPRQSVGRGPGVPQHCHRHRP
jgi:hypothetical protein